MSRGAPIAGEPYALPNNPELRGLLDECRQLGRIDEEAAKKIKQRAGKLSLEEAEAIRAALREITGVSHQVRNQLEDFVWDGLKDRTQYLERARRRTDIIEGVLIATTLVGVPLLGQVLSFGPVGELINNGANAVQVALLAGEHFAARRYFKKASERYGAEE